MKPLPRLAPLLLLALALAAPGCQQKVAPGSDPIVVNAERAEAVSFEAADAFVTFAHDNRDTLRAFAPDVHAAAERVRRDYPPANREFRKAIALYKATRAAADLNTMEGRLAALQSLARVAREWLAKATERGLARDKS